MELKELKIVFDSGGLKSAIIKKAPLMNGYILIIETTNKKSHVMTAQRETKHVPRTFKSIGAAASNAQKIGFQHIAIDLS